MRWANLSLAADEQRQLPGYREQAVVRRFDAPEALDIRFYEVRARSALNRVPGASRMPFRWTINPYRGCTHACVYCLWGGTPILMADGRSRPLELLEVGDEIYGTDGSRSDAPAGDGGEGRPGEPDGAGSFGEPGGVDEETSRDPARLTPTRVLAKWSSIRRAYRVLLDDGGELLASGDHRFLTTEGWRHVSAGDPGQVQRPCLRRGSRLAGPAGERVVSAVRPLGMRLRMYDITTGSGDFVADGVISHNCFARPTHRYLDFGPGRDFEREIVVKVNAPELLRAELARPSWKGEQVALGTNTDPYQWVEGRYRLMVGIWEALRDAHGGAGNLCSVLTKSPLLLRDLGLMREIAARTQFSACLSIPTLDERAWRATEPHTPNPRARLEAVAELSRAGISTGVLIAPLMPGINDSPRQLEPLIQGAIEAGASSVAGAALHLRRDVREVFMQWLGDQRPELLPRYEELYARGAYAPRAERERLGELVRDGRRGRVPGRGRFLRPAPGAADGPSARPGRRRAAASPASSGPVGSGRAAMVDTHQETLF
ncbi:MAG TPA: hypothetical protein VMU32_12775 [Solirubrobacteraceae bacterium]|nr:hypothetical protein [Solirubrobacteraceae bacterium]